MKCGIEEDDLEKRLEKLRALNPEQIIEENSTVAVGPMADGMLLPSSWNLGERLPTSRCKSIILGDTRMDAIIFDSLSRRLPQTQFYELVRSAFSETDATAFLHHFGFKTEPMPYDAYRDAMRLFLCVAMFQILQEALRWRWLVFGTFAHGQEPWETYSKSHRFMRSGPVGERP